jgi:hypothetical protein
MTSASARHILGEEACRALRVLGGSAWTAVLASLLCFTTSCGVEPAEDDPETASAAQPVTGGCHILRPYGWSGVYPTCVESQFNNVPLDLAPGESFTFFSGNIVGTGVGRVTVVCHLNGDGRWDEVDRSCRRRIFVEP